MDLTSLTTSPYHQLLRKRLNLSLWEFAGQNFLKILRSNSGNKGYKHSPLFCSTQIPHAVGAAYSLKMDKKDACAVTYFGDGGTSEVNMNTEVQF